MCPCLCPWTLIVLVRIPKSVYSIWTHYIPWDLHIQMRSHIWLFLWLTKTILGSWVYYVGTSHRTNQRKDMVNNFFPFLTYVGHIKSKIRMCCVQNGALWDSISGTAATETLDRALCLFASYRRDCAHARQRRQRWEWRELVGGGGGGRWVTMIANPEARNSEDI